jgi:hypothetical protein
MTLPHFRVKSPRFMPPRGSIPYGENSAPLACQVIDFPQPAKSSRSPCAAKADGASS